MADINQFRTTIDLPLRKKPAATTDSSALWGVWTVWNGEKLRYFRGPVCSFVGRVDGMERGEVTVLQVASL